MPYVVKLLPQVIDTTTGQPVPSTSIQITFSSTPVVWGPNGPQSGLGPTPPTATIIVNGTTIPGVPVQ